MEDVALWAFERDDEEESPPVVLRLSNGREIESAAWFDCNEAQDEHWLPSLGAETWSNLIKLDDVVAFYDRTALDARWRTAFVVCAEENIHLLHIDGELVDEVDTPNGVQSTQKFLQEWEAGYYRLARSSEEVPLVGDEEEEGMEEETRIHRPPVEFDGLDKEARARASFKEREGVSPSHSQLEQEMEATGDGVVVRSVVEAEAVAEQPCNLIYRAVQDLCADLCADTPISGLCVCAVADNGEIATVATVYASDVASYIPHGYVLVVVDGDGTTDPEISLFTWRHLYKCLHMATSNGHLRCLSRDEEDTSDGSMHPFAPSHSAEPDLVEKLKEEAGADEVTFEERCRAPRPQRG